MTLIDTAIAYCQKHGHSFDLDFFGEERTITVKGDRHSVEMMEDAGTVFGFIVRGDVAESVGPVRGMVELVDLVKA